MATVYAALCAWMNQWAVLSIVIHACMQAAASVSITPSSTVASVGTTAVTYTLPALSGLQASTGHTYTVLRGDGTAVEACTDLGDTDASGAYTSLTGPDNGLTYATATSTAYTSVLVVYTRDSCAASANPSASSVAVRRGSASVTVSTVQSLVRPSTADSRIAWHKAPHTPGLARS